MYVYFVIISINIITCKQAAYMDEDMYQEYIPRNTNLEFVEYCTNV